MATATWRQQQKRDTDANWAMVAASFIPLDGEICVYKTSKKMKVGDGVTPIGSLPFSGGEDDYEKLTNKPILVTQTTYENDQTGTTGMLVGQMIYKISDNIATLEELIGGMVNGSVPLTAINCMDVTTALAPYGVTANTIAYSPNNFSSSPPQMAVISCDAPIDVQAMYTNIPSAGVWAVADVTSVALRPSATIDELYESFFLPATDASNVGQAAQVGTDGKWTAGAQIPIIGVQSWREVQRNVKLGRGPALYPVHTIFNVRHKKFGSIPFEVVAHDVDADPDDGSAHTMTLLMLEGLTRGSTCYAFDEREKLCNCPSGLAAGSYFANIGAISNAKSAVTPSWSDDIWGFTLTQSVPSGGYLAFDIDYYNTWKPISITSYASNGTAIEAVAVTENSSTGADIMTVLSLDDINYGRCARWGSSNYKQSAIRQWLLATGSGWWTPKTAFDLPPDYVDEEGFFGGLDSEFAGVLLETEQITSTSKEYEEIETVNSSYTLTDKIFLASDIQIAGFCADQAATEGTEWPAFTGLSDSDEPARIKYKHGTIGTEDTAAFWWLRSTYPSLPEYVRVVSLDGITRAYSSAYGRGYGVAAACVI